MRDRARENAAAIQPIERKKFFRSPSTGAPPYHTAKQEFPSPRRRDGPTPPSRRAFRLDFVGLSQ